MSKYRYQYGLVLLSLLLVCFGCTTMVSNVRSHGAETNGDIAYQKKDYPGALAEYRKSAELGGVYGKFMLANMYFEGQAVKRDPKKATRLMQESADGGFPPANYVMGMARLNGSGVKPDAVIAARHFELAAAKEHGSSMHMLGLMAALGIGVKQDEGEALRWFRLANAQDFPVQDQLLSESGLHAYVKKNRANAAQARKKAVTRQKMVREVQQTLTTLGYDPGPVDGLFGKKTSAAIKAFQRKKGLEPDGQATTKLLEALKRAR